MGGLRRIAGLRIGFVSAAGLPSGLLVAATGAAFRVVRRAGLVSASGARTVSARCSAKLSRKQFMKNSGSGIIMRSETAHTQRVPL